jgi:NDP-sugar pyrophosphorylase family protein
MKALLILPAERPALSALAQRRPLAALPFLGQSIVEYWLQHLAARGARHVIVLAADRRGVISALVDDGARWGLEVDVVQSKCEFTLAEAREYFREMEDDEPWLDAPLDIITADTLPGLSSHQPMESYVEWFRAACAWMPHALTPDRVGLRELRPGVWLGFHARVSPDAQIEGPCWIGDDVRVGPGAIIGPNTILENRVYVEAGAHLHDCIVGPDTFVGGMTELGHSIAWGDLLIDWRTGSNIHVREDFLLCSLEQPPPHIAASRWLRRNAGQLTRAIAGQVTTFWRRTPERAPSPPAGAPRPEGSRSTI